MKPSTSRFLPVRGLSYHVREWGKEGAPKLFLLHGWGDASITFQFLVDALGRDWHVLAPDWRGFGLTRDTSADCFWFPDYLADLDCLLDQLAPNGPVRLVGHSMGGNVACLYAGVRPQRVAQLVALDAFGLPDVRPDAVPERYARWLDELKTPVSFKRYPEAAQFADRLRDYNPRLSAEQAAYLAREFTTELGDGRFAAQIEPAHRRVNPVPYRRADAEACWKRVSAEVLWVLPADAGLRHRLRVSDQDIDAALACFPRARRVVVEAAGHNLHHDQPARVAECVEEFLHLAAEV
jgi:pimeloyl-ACP methyl ester carboxylesterase